MNKGRARQLPNQIGGDGARPNEPVTFGVFVRKRASNAVVQINLTSERPIVLLRGRSST